MLSKLVLVPGSTSASTTSSSVNPFNNWSLLDGDDDDDEASPDNRLCLLGELGHEFDAPDTLLLLADEK